jgi:hypothetical protein
MRLSDNASRSHRARSETRNTIQLSQLADLGSEITRSEEEQKIFIGVEGVDEPSKHEAPAPF